MKKTAFLSGSALLLLLSSGTALAQQTLEDRVRALEQKLGVPAEMPGDNRSLEDRVKAIEAHAGLEGVPVGFDQLDGEAFFFEKTFFLGGEDRRFAHEANPADFHLD